MNGWEGTLTLLNGEEDGPPEYDWSKPSLAVVASDGDGRGCVLWTAGPHVQSFLDEIGRGLDDIGLDDAPDGISVWEGKIKTYHYYEGDYDADLTGKFREPSDEEWQSIQRGECPWNDEDWIKKP